MKAYIIADVHLLRKAFNYKPENLKIQRLRSFLMNEMSPGSLLIVAGDFFDTPLIRTHKELKIFKKVIEVLIEASEKKNIRTIIMDGNHDKKLRLKINKEDTEDGDDGISDDSEEFMAKEEFDIVEETTGITELFSLVKGAKLPEKCSIEDLPLITFISESTSTTIDGQRFMFIPFPTKKNYYEENKEIFNTDNTIFIMHDAIETELLNKSSSFFDVKLIKKNSGNIMIKGHIHNKYNSILHGIPVYSVGSFLSKKKTDTTGFVEIESNGSNEVVVNPKEFPDSLDIKYIDYVCNENNVNNFLKNIKENSIVNIVYKGDQKKIDPLLFSKCSASCLSFNFIFTCGNIGKSIRSSDGESMFISFDDYLKENSNEEIYEHFKRILSSTE